MQMFTTGLKVKLNKSKLRPGESAKLEDHGLQEAAEERKEQAACADDNQRPGKTKGCYTCKSEIILLWNIQKTAVSIRGLRLIPE